MNLKSHPFSLDCLNFAGIAQLVERNLPKVEVTGSNPVPRSTVTRGWYANVSDWVFQRYSGSSPVHHNKRVEEKLNRSST